MPNFERFIDRKTFDNLVYGIPSWPRSTGLCLFYIFCPVILSYASRYLAAVLATISSGTVTSSLPLSPLLVSQSLKNCLSKLGCALPRFSSHVSFGQKRELSGVSTSSTSTTSLSSV